MDCHISPYIVMPDIDNLIIDFVDLPDLVMLLCVSKYLYSIVFKKPVVRQWSSINNIVANNVHRYLNNVHRYSNNAHRYPNQIILTCKFSLTCQMGYIDYAKYLHSIANHASSFDDNTTSLDDDSANLDNDSTSSDDDSASSDDDLTSLDNDSSSAILSGILK